MRIILLMLSMCLCSIGFAGAGVPVDMDGDGLFCMQEDDGLYCGEDDQDKCDFIPNISRDDGHCAMDLDGDGKFTLTDIAVGDQLGGHTLWSNSYGGDTCFYRIKILTYNNRLALAGLPPLQLDEPFIVTAIPVHCTPAHHTYPAIP